jgi:hypothetical protein
MSLVRAVPVVLLLALVAPAAAHASATLSFTGTAPHKILTFTVDDALDHSTSASRGSNDVVISDRNGVAVGASGCSSDDANTARCGSAADIERVMFVFGDGSDRLDIGGDFSSVTADGGAGDDVLVGGTGNDQLSGGTGDDELYGMTGDDVLVGGADDDYLHGDLGADELDGGVGDDDLRTAETPPRADAAISCGPGSDTLLEDNGVDPLAPDCETTAAPKLAGAPAVIGDPHVGSALSLSPPDNIGGAGDVTLLWWRCNTAGNGCYVIDGASKFTYAPTSADLGKRLRAIYIVDNALGEDWLMSEPTAIVRAAPTPPTPPTLRPPHPAPHPPYSRADPLKLTIAPFVLARKPSFAVRDGRPVVDTGWTMSCPGVKGGLPCRLHLSARPAGASAHWLDAPAVAGESAVDVAAGAGASVRFQLGKRAYRLLRGHGRLRLSIAATVTRSHSAPVKATFVITIKAPPTRRY